MAKQCYGLIKVRGTYKCRAFTAANKYNAQPEVWFRAAPVDDWLLRGKTDWCPDVASFTGSLAALASTHNRLDFLVLYVEVSFRTLQSLPNILASRLLDAIRLQVYIPRIKVRGLKQFVVVLLSERLATAVVEFRHTVAAMQVCVREWPAQKCDLWIILQVHRCTRHARV